MPSVLITQVYLYLQLKIQLFGFDIGSLASKKVACQQKSVCNIRPLLTSSVLSGVIKNV